MNGTLEKLNLHQLYGERLVASFGLRRSVLSLPVGSIYPLAVFHAV